MNTLFEVRYDEGFLALISDVINYEQDEEWIGKSISALPCQRSRFGSVLNSMTYLKNNLNGGS